MAMIIIVIKIFILAFLINLFWEVCHSLLYQTCLKSPLKNYVKLILKASLKDAFFITSFYLMTVLIFKNFYVLNNNFQLAAFMVICLLFSYADEIISLHYKRWEYSKEMPKIFGAGLTPLFELAVTGLVVLLISF